MRNILYLFILAILGCNNKSDPPKQKEKIPAADIIASKPKIDNSKYYTKEDRLIIAFENRDSLTYKKSFFNKIVDDHPEFFQEYPSSPDETYSCYPGFCGEAGQDEYYMLYAYFLKQQNGIAKYAERRKRIIDIYSEINSIFAHLRHGGTYFGHQYSRILGYAEYSIYLYKDVENDHDFYRIYDIAKQKNHYINLLRQLIADEIKNDTDITNGESRIELNKKLNPMVDKLDRLITDKFCLQRAIEFQYVKYNY